jgi:hypothetical protein
MGEEKGKTEEEVILDWVADNPTARIGPMLNAVRELMLRHPLESYFMVRNLPIALPWLVEDSAGMYRANPMGKPIAQVTEGGGPGWWHVRMAHDNSWTKHGRFPSKAQAMERADTILTTKLEHVLCPQPCSICQLPGPIHWHEGAAWRGACPAASVMHLGDRRWTWCHPGECWDKYIQQRTDLEAAEFLGRQEAAARGGQHEPARTTPGGTAVGHPIRGPHRSWRDVEFPPPRSQGQDRANAVRRNLESQTSGRAFAIRVEMLADEVHSALRDDPGKPVRLTREQSMKLYQTVRIAQRELLAYDARAEPELPEPPYEVLGPLLDGYCRIYTQSQPSDWTGYEVALPSREQP